MAFTRYIPGHQFTLPNGVEVRCVLARDIPKRFIEAKKIAGSYTIPVLSTLRAGKWQFYDDPKYDEWESGGFEFSSLISWDDDDAPEYHPDKCVVAVPIRYLEPETNEFGEISP